MFNAAGCKQAQTCSKVQKYFSQIQVLIFKIYQSSILQSEKHVSISETDSICRIINFELGISSSTVMS